MNVSRIEELEKRVKLLETQSNISDTKLVSIDNLIIIKKGLLFFFIILSGNYLGKLLACQTQRLFTNDMIAKHTIGLISLYFFVIITDDKMQKYNPLMTLLLTVIIYVYFLLMAKVETSYFIVIMLLLSLLVLLQIYKEYLYTKEDDKLENYEIHVKKLIYKLQNIILFLSFFLTIFGALVYLGMKKEEYGKDFKLQTFLLGKPNCKNNLLGNKPINKNKNVHQGILHHFKFIKEAFYN